MTATDSELYRAFALRVRTTVATTPEGSPTMNDTTVETAAAAVPATFRSAVLRSTNPHDDHGWCAATDPNADCYGPEVSLPIEDNSGPGLLVGQLHYDAEEGGTFLIYQRHSDWLRLTSDELRAETAQARAHLARLDALADQYDAIREAAGPTDAAPPQQTAEQPRTWSFVDKEGQFEETVTCMLGCPSKHELEQMAPYSAGNVDCHIVDTGVELPVLTGSLTEAIDEILRVTTRVEPFSHSLARRLPNVSVEIVEDHFVEPLDPDGLQVVIDAVQSRVDAMREARLHLIAARAEYMQHRAGGTR